MSDIFISYAHADREVTEALFNWLSENQYDSYYDRELIAGSRFEDVIEDTIKSARATLVIWSPESIMRDWVKHEASVAKAAGNYVPLRTPELDPRGIPAPYQSRHTVKTTDREAILRAIENRGVQPKDSADEAITAQMLRSGAVAPSAPAAKSLHLDGGSLIGRFLSAIVGGGNTIARGPLAGLFDRSPWPNRKMSRSTPFLHYDPEFLRSLYSSENPILGEQPYSELFDFSELAANHIEPRIELEIVDAPFALAPWGNVGDEIVESGRRALIESGKVSDEQGSLIRLERVYVRNGRIMLRVRPAVYGDQVRSNLIADYEHPDSAGNNWSVRKLLALEYGTKLPPLADRRLANTLGIATILFYMHDGVWTPALWVRASNLAVFEGGWHCSASGAAEWWNKTDVPTFDNLIVGDMLREIEEELRILRPRITALVPIALCREFARLGKPQLFFAGLVDLDHDELVAGAEAAGKRAEALGLKRETVQTALYGYPKDIAQKMHKLQHLRGRTHHEARYFDADDLFGRVGLTTECVANLYYASNALPFLTSVAASKSRP